MNQKNSEHPANNINGVRIYTKFRFKYSALKGKPLLDTARPEKRKIYDASFSPPEERN